MINRRQILSLSRLTEEQIVRAENAYADEQAEAGYALVNKQPRLLHAPELPMYNKVMKHLEDQIEANLSALALYTQLAKDCETETQGLRDMLEWMVANG